MTDKEKTIERLKKSENYVVICVVNDEVYQSISVKGMNPQEFIDELGEVQAKLKRVKKP